jgi:oligoribonuclease NrnB/cAMP/cGMP phosphodiesterase (DHH superfamily)
MLLAGLFFAGIGYILILFKEKTVKQKMFWTFVLLCGVAIQFLTEASLIKQSYSTYINGNYQLLTKANEIIMSKPDGIYGLDSTEKESGKFSKEELSILSMLRKKAKVRFISKYSNRIFYCLSGAIDIYNGVCFISKINPGEPKFNHIKDDWYY